MRRQTVRSVRHFSVGLAGALTILAGLCGFSKAAGAALAPPEMPDWKQAKSLGQVDYAWALLDMKGNRVTLDQFKGKVVLLNFWATWCLPCVAEMPSIQRLQEKLKDTDVAVVLVALEGGASTKKFLKKHELCVPCYLPLGEIPGDFKASGLPVTFVIDRQGAIVFRHLGAATWDDESVVQFLRGLAGGANP